MARQKKPTTLPTPAEHVDPSAAWTRSTDITVNGRQVTPGTELSIDGESGRFRFVKLVETPTGASWVDVVGGPKDHNAWRSFRVDRIKTVHRIARTRASHEAAQAA